MPGPSDSLPRLLYVEDDATIAAIALEVLGEDYDVTHAVTGEQGLELALRHRFDVMVIDRRLPGMKPAGYGAIAASSGIATLLLVVVILTIWKR